MPSCYIFYLCIKSSTHSLIILFRIVLFHQMMIESRINSLIILWDYHSPFYFSLQQGCLMWHWDNQSFTLGGGRRHRIGKCSYIYYAPSSTVRLDVRHVKHDTLDKHYGKYVIRQPWFTNNFCRSLILLNFYYSHVKEHPRYVFTFTFWYNNISCAFFIAFCQKSPSVFKIKHAIFEKYESSQILWG